MEEYKSAFLAIVRKHILVNRRLLTELYNSVSFETFLEELKRFPIKKIYREERSKFLQLDIGCGRGQKEAYSTIGVDVHYSRSDGEMIRSNSLPFRCCFSLVTAYMSLHHIENLEKKISEVVKVLEPEGVFVIKEHDALQSPSWLKFMKRVHLFFCRCVDRQDELSCGYTKYRSKEQLISIIEKRGLTLIKSTKSKGPMRVYTASFKKLGVVKIANLIKIVNGGATTDLFETGEHKEDSKDEYKTKQSPAKKDDL